MLLRWRNDPLVSAYMYSDHVIEADEHDRWFQNAIVDGVNVHRVIIYDQEPAGLSSLTRISLQSRSCVWGGYLAPEVKRSAGIGSAVLSQSLEYAFTIKALRRVTVEAFADNGRAIRLYESLGFRREGYFREFTLKGGVPKDVVSLAILQREWNAQSREPK
jgi:UDP-4-amino-4,6-dideoxy-N-acetyl-beta-L-altrosamine N-acetyltransferase